MASDRLGLAIIGRFKLGVIGRFKLGVIGPIKLVVIRLFKQGAKIKVVKLLTLTIWFF